MANFEVPNPILNTPFEEPKRYWFIQEGEAPKLLEGRRPSVVFRPSEQRVEWDLTDGTLKASGQYAAGYDLVLVNLIRERLKQWKAQNYAGVSGVTLELLKYWQREGRKHRLFYAQLHAVEAMIFLTEARSDLRQGINVPRDLPHGQKDSQGGDGFARYALKLATGTGKTTVMGMLAAWSILNKVNDRSDGRFSDTVLVVCPNVTIRSRLQEIDPRSGDSSLYRARDLVPEHLMPRLMQGRVIVTNWHIFAPKTAAAGGESARVIKTGVRQTREELIHIGPKNDTARGKRYLTLETLQRQAALGQLAVISGSENRDKDGGLVSVRVVVDRYVESDAAIIERILRREGAGKKNILVLNDEAHHAYRVRKDTTEEEDSFEEGESEEEEQFFEEATVWVEGLDRINARCGINFCVDLSATPYFLGRVGQATSRPFPWTISDFGLIDAIEAGLVKIPQLAVRDTTGQQVAGFFNIWKYVLEKLTPAERGGRKASPKPEAVLKHAALPINQLAGLWEQECANWKQARDVRTPVFIIVCKNTKIAKVIYEWLAEGITPAGLPPSAIEGFRNKGAINTIRVDSKVAFETDSGEAKDDEQRWMRHTLDTVGRLEWPRDAAGRPIYPDAFESLAKKLERPLHPPGRDVRCIVSVGMLTEGWDCQTVTHIIGLRPFMSQLLCEQVVGRGLRRRTYQAEDEQGLFPEEVSKVFGVPFDVIPFKQTEGAAPPPVERRHVHALPNKARFEIKFPRVVGYTQAVRNRVAVNWDAVPVTPLDPLKIPGETEVKGLSISTRGRMSLFGPGRLDRVGLEAFRKKLRLQRVMFDLASDLTRVLIGENHCQVPPHKLFPQALRIVEQYFADWVKPVHPFEKVDAWHSPFYGQVLGRLRSNIQPDTEAGEAPEIPVYEKNRGLGSSSDVDFWTSRPVWPVEHSQVNYFVADTKQWEQSASYFVDTHRLVRAFVKNAGLGFAIPCFYTGQEHDYLPDFIIRLEMDHEAYLILETKGRPDEHKADKAAGARRWVNAVNADGRYGSWEYAVVDSPPQVSRAIEDAFTKLNLVAKQEALVAYLVNQLGQRPWSTIARRLASHLMGAQGHEINFGAFMTLAERFGCAVEDLHKAVEVLSHADGGPLERVFVRQSGHGNVEVSPEEVATKARAFYLEKSIAPNDWSTWAGTVQVVWKLKPSQARTGPSA